MSLLSWLKKKPSELFPGVTKPTTTVAYLLVAEMLQNLDSHTKTNNVWNDNTISTTKFPSFTISVKHVRAGRDYSNSRNIPESYSIESEQSEFPVVFDGREKEILIEGYKKFLRLKKDALALEKETKNQEKAVNFIADMMKTKEVADHNAKVQRLMKADKLEKESEDDKA
jgi:hypothetical protein